MPTDNVPCMFVHVRTRTLANKAVALYLANQNTIVFDTLRWRKMISDIPPRHTLCLLNALSSVINPSWGVCLSSLEDRGVVAQNFCSCNVVCVTLYQIHDVFTKSQEM